MPDSQNSDLKLTAVPALDDLALDYDGVNIREITDHALVSLAIPNHTHEIVNQTVSASYHVSLPKVGLSAFSKIDNTHILAMQTDQYFLLFDYIGNQAVKYLKTKIDDVAYLCDQSDSWVMLRITGEASRMALERICPIDLHPKSFPERSVSRTVMEHLAVIIFHECDNTFLLMSPRSSAKSFLHAITQSIENIS